MEILAVVVVENGVIIIYESADRQALVREVNRAKEKGLPYAVLSPEEFTTV